MASEAKKGKDKKKDSLFFASFVVSSTIQAPCEAVSFKNDDQLHPTLVPLSSYASLSFDSLRIYYSESKESPGKTTKVRMINCQKTFDGSSDTVTPDSRVHFVFCKRSLTAEDLNVFMRFLAECSERFSKDGILGNSLYRENLAYKFSFCIFSNVSPATRQTALERLLNWNQTSELKAFLLESEGISVYLACLDQSQLNSEEQKVIGLLPESIQPLKKMIVNPVFQKETSKEYQDHIFKSLTGLLMNFTKDHRLLIPIINHELSFLPFGYAGRILSNAKKEFLSSTERNMFALIHDKPQRVSMELLQAIFTYFKKEKIPSLIASEIAQNFISLCKEYRPRLEELLEKFQEEALVQNFSDFWPVMDSSAKFDLFCFVLERLESIEDLVEFLPFVLDEVEADSRFLTPLKKVVERSKEEFELLKRFKVLKMLLPYFQEEIKGVKLHLQGEWQAWLMENVDSAFIAFLKEKNVPQKIDEWSDSVLFVLRRSFSGARKPKRELFRSFLNQIFQSCQEILLFNAIFLLELAASSMDDQKEKRTEDQREKWLQNELTAKETQKELGKFQDKMQGTHKEMKALSKSALSFTFFKGIWFKEPWILKAILRISGCQFIKFFLGFCSQPDLAEKDEKEFSEALNGILETFIESFLIDATICIEFLWTLSQKVADKERHLPSRMVKVIEKHCSGVLLPFPKSPQSFKAKTKQNLEMEFSFEGILFSRQQKQNILVIFCQLSSIWSSIPWLSALEASLSGFIESSFRSFAFRDLADYNSPSNSLISESIKKSFPKSHDLLKSYEQKYLDSVYLQEKLRLFIKHFRYFANQHRKMTKELKELINKRDLEPMSSISLSSRLTSLFLSNSRIIGMIQKDNKVFRKFFDRALLQTSRDSEDPVTQVLLTTKQLIVDFFSPQQLEMDLASFIEAPGIFGGEFEQNTKEEIENQLKELLKETGTSIDMEEGLLHLLVNVNQRRLKSIDSFLSIVVLLHEATNLSLNKDDFMELQVFKIQRKKMKMKEAQPILLRFLEAFSKVEGFFERVVPFSQSFSEMLELIKELNIKSDKVLQDVEEALSDKFKASVYGNQIDSVDVIVLKKLKAFWNGFGTIAQGPETILRISKGISDLTKERKDFLERVQGYSKKLAHIKNLLENISDFNKAVRARISRILDPEAQAQLILKQVHHQRDSGDVFTETLNDLIVSVEFLDPETKKEVKVDKAELDDYYTNLNVFRSTEKTEEKSDEKLRIFESIHEIIPLILREMEDLKKFGFETRSLIQNFQNQKIWLLNEGVERVLENIRQENHKWKKNIENLRKKYPKMLIYTGREIHEIITALQRAQNEHEEAERRDSQSNGLHAQFPFGVHYQIHQLLLLSLSENFPLVNLNESDLVPLAILSSLQGAIKKERTWEGKFEAFSKFIQENAKTKKKRPCEFLARRNRNSDFQKSVYLLESEEENFGVSLLWAIQAFSDQGVLPLPESVLVVSRYANSEELLTFLKHQGTNEQSDATIMLLPNHPGCQVGSRNIKTLHEYFRTMERSTKNIVVIHHKGLKRDSIAPVSSSKSLSLSIDDLKCSLDFFKSVVTRADHDVSLVMSDVSGNGKTFETKKAMRKQLDCDKFIDIQIGGHTNMSRYSQRLFKAFRKAFESKGATNKGKMLVNFSIGLPENIGSSEEVNCFCSSITVLSVLMIVLRGYRNRNGINLTLSDNIFMSFELGNSPCDVVLNRLELRKLLPIKMLKGFTLEKLQWGFGSEEAIEGEAQWNWHNDPESTKEALRLFSNSFNKSGELHLGAIGSSSDYEGAKGTYDEIFLSPFLKRTKNPSFLEASAFISRSLFETHSFHQNWRANEPLRKKLHSDRPPFEEVERQIVKDASKALFEISLKSSEPPQSYKTQKEPTSSSIEEYNEVFDESDDATLSFIAFYHKAKFILISKDSKLVPNEFKRLFLYELLLRNSENKEILEYFLSKKEEIPKNIEEEFLRAVSEGTSPEKLWGILEELTGCAREKLFDKRFILTQETLFKILKICRKLQARTPLILRGETGTGKTFMMKYIADHLLDFALNTASAPNTNPKEPNPKFKKGSFEYVLMHAGFNEEKLIAMVSRQIETAKKPENNSVLFLVFLDEFNTCSSIDIVSNLLTKRSFLWSSEPLQNQKMADSLPPNLLYIGACNPFITKKASETIQRKANTLVISGKALRRVYTVNPCTPRINYYTMDFGHVKIEQEAQYLEGMLIDEFLVFDEVKMGMLKCGFESIGSIAEVLVECHKFIRDNIEKREVSLRDLRKFIRCFLWLFQSFFIHLRIEKAEELFLLSLVSSIGIIYYSRLPTPKLRKKFSKETIQCVFDSIQSNGGTNHLDLFKRIDPLLERRNNRILKFSRMFRACCRSLLSKMTIPKGISKNSALMENIFCLFVCLNVPLPVVLVGKPGSSKSLSFQLVANHLRGLHAPLPFFKNFPEASINYFQGSEITDSKALEQVFIDTINKKAFLSPDLSGYSPESSKEAKGMMYSANSVLVIDELGLAETSRHNPLKVLHRFLDEQEETQVGFVGMTNWALDAAKNSRMVMVYRPRISKRDLVKIAEEISASYGKVNGNGTAETSQSKPLWNESYEKEKELWRVLAFAYRKHMKLMRSKGEEDFHGLRDFYNLIRGISSKMKELLRMKEHLKTFEKDICALVTMKVQRNFGGLKDSSEQFLSCIEEEFRLAEKFSMAEVFNDFMMSQSFRYPMIISDLQGNNLIESLGIGSYGHKEPLELVGLPSSSPVDLQEAQITRDLIKIQEAMAFGRLVIIRSYSSIYSSLFEVFNMKKTEKFGKKFTEIAFKDKLNREVVIDDEFRFILVLTIEEAKKATSPFLNRFEKYFVSREVLGIQADPEKASSIKNKLFQCLNNGPAISDGPGSSGAGFKGRSFTHISFGQLTVSSNRIIPESLNEQRSKMSSSGFLLFDIEKYESLVREVIESYLIHTDDNESKAFRKIAKWISPETLLQLSLKKAELKPLLKDSKGLTDRKSREMNRNSREVKENSSLRVIEETMELLDHNYTRYSVPSLQEVLEKFRKQSKRKNLAILTDSLTEIHDLGSFCFPVDLSYSFKGSKIHKNDLFILQITENELDYLPHFIILANGAKARLVVCIQLFRNSKKQEKRKNLVSICHPETWKVVFRSGESNGIGLARDQSILDFIENESLCEAFAKFGPKKMAFFIQEILSQNFNWLLLGSQKTKTQKMIQVLQSFEHESMNELNQRIFPLLIKENARWRSKLLDFFTNTGSFSSCIESFLVQSPPSESVGIILAHLAHFGFPQAAANTKNLKASQENIKTVQKVYLKSFAKSFDFEWSSLDALAKKIKQMKKEKEEPPLDYPFRLPWFSAKLKEVFDGMKKSITVSHGVKFLKGELLEGVLATMKKSTDPIFEQFLHSDPLKKHPECLMCDWLESDILKFALLEVPLNEKEEETLKKTITEISEKLIPQRKRLSKVEGFLFVVLCVHRLLFHFVSFSKKVGIPFEDGTKASMKDFSFQFEEIMDILLRRTGEILQKIKKSRAKREENLASLTEVLQDSSNFVEFFRFRTKISFSSADMLVSHSFWNTGKLLLKLLWTLKGLESVHGSLIEAIELALKSRKKTNDIIPTILKQHIFPALSKNSEHLDLSIAKAIHFSINRFLLKAMKHSRLPKPAVHDVSSSQLELLLSVMNSDKGKAKELSSIVVEILLKVLDSELINPLFPSDNPIAKVLEAAYSDSLSQLFRLAVHIRLKEEFDLCPERPFFEKLEEKFGKEVDLIIESTKQDHRNKIRMDLSYTLLGVFLDSVCSELLKEPQNVGMLRFLKKSEGRTPIPLDVLVVRKLYWGGMTLNQINSNFKHVPGMGCLESFKLDSDKFEFTLRTEWPENKAILENISKIQKGEMKLSNFSKRELFCLFLAFMVPYADMEAHFFAKAVSLIDTSSQPIDNMLKSLITGMSDFPEMSLSSKDSDISSKRFKNTSILLAFLCAAMGRKGLSSIFVPRGVVEPIESLKKMFIPGSLSRRDGNLLFYLELDCRWRNYRDSYDKGVLNLFIECQETRADGSKCGMIYPLYACNNPEFKQHCRGCNSLWDAEYVKRNHRDNIFTELLNDIARSQETSKGLNFPEISKFGKKVPFLVSMHLFSYKMLQFIQLSFVYFASKWEKSYRFHDEDTWNFKTTRQLHQRINELIEEMRLETGLENSQFHLWLWDFLIRFFEAFDDFNYDPSLHSSKKTFEKEFDALLMRHLKDKKTGVILKEQFKREIDMGMLMEGSEKHSNFYKKIKEKRVFQIESKKNLEVILKMDPGDHIISKDMSPLTPLLPSLYHLIKIYSDMLKQSGKLSIIDAKRTSIQAWIKSGFLSKVDFEEFKRASEAIPKDFPLSLGCREILQREISTNTKLFFVLPGTKERFSSNKTENPQELSEAIQEKQAGWLIVGLIMSLSEVQNNLIRKFMEKYPEWKNVIDPRNDKEALGIGQIEQMDIIQFNQELLMKKIIKHTKYSLQEAGEGAQKVIEQIDFDAVDREFCFAILKHKRFLLPMDFHSFPVYKYKEEILASQLEVLGNCEQEPIGMKSLESTKEFVTYFSEMAMEKSISSRLLLHQCYCDFVTLVSWVQNGAFDSRDIKRLKLDDIFTEFEMNSSLSMLKNSIRQVDRIRNLEVVRGLPVRNLRQALMELEVLMIRVEQREFKSLYEGPIKEKMELLQELKKLEENLVFFKLELAAILYRYLLTDVDRDEKGLNDQLIYSFEPLHDFFEPSVQLALLSFLESKHGQMIQSRSALSLFNLVDSI